MTEKTLDGARTSFDRYLNVIRIGLTRGLQYLLPFWFSQTPMFWLPHGWLPYYAEWILSLPRAPLGSVSIASWQVACSGAIALFGETVAAVIGLVRGSGQTRAVPEKMATAAESKKDT